MDASAWTGRASARVAGATVAALALLAVACARQSDSFDYSGTLQADSASIGSTAGGRVTGLPAADGERVRTGQLIVLLDDRQLRAAYVNAIAMDQQAVAALADLEAGPRPADVEKAQAAAAQAQADYRKAQLEHPQDVQNARSAVAGAVADARSAHAASDKADRDEERSQALYSEGAIAAQEMDAAREADAAARGAAASADARLRSAQSQLAAVTGGAAQQTVESAANAAAAAQAQLTLVREGSRSDQIAQARAAVAAAAANVVAARARLDETRVVSPADGIVDGLDLRPGDLVAAGAAVAQIDEFGDPWVRIYVTQSDMERVKVGAAVRVRSDALGGRIFDGRIETIDAQAQFTPRDVQTAEDRADLSFGVKVRIHDPDRALRAGTTVAVSLQ